MTSKWSKINYAKRNNEKKAKNTIFLVKKSAFVRGPYIIFFRRPPSRGPEIFFLKGLILGICKRTQSAEGSAGGSEANQTEKVLWPGFSLTESGINFTFSVYFWFCLFLVFSRQSMSGQNGLQA